MHLIVLQEEQVEQFLLAEQAKRLVMLSEVEGQALIIQDVPPELEEVAVDIMAVGVVKVIMTWGMAVLPLFPGMQDVMR